MATCKECIHEKLCVIKAFPDAFENTEWSKEPCDHFKMAQGEIKNALLELKKQIHDKATYPETQGISPYISLKIFDAILNNQIKRYTEGTSGEQISQ